MGLYVIVCREPIYSVFSFRETHMTTLELFTSETKKAGSDREAPVNHIGYLQTFINKTHVVTSVIAL